MPREYRPIGRGDRARDVHAKQRPNVLAFTRTVHVSAPSPIAAYHGERRSASGGSAVMSDENETLIREAYAAYGQGDTAKMVALVHPDLEWTYLDPAFGAPEPQTCHGRPRLLQALARQARQGLAPVIEEIASSGNRVMVVVHTPGVDQYRARPADDRNYLVLTLRQRQVIAMRACRDRAEAAGLAGLG